MNVNEFTAIIEKHRQEKNAVIGSIAVTASERIVQTRSGSRRMLVYEPTSRSRWGEKLPVYFDIHGGGFVAGAPEINEPFARLISDELGIVVICPSYRLAPEHKFPCAREDVLDEILYAYEHAASFGIDPKRMAVGGQSAGGNIATSLCLESKTDSRLSFKCVLLDYPPLDFSIDPHDRKYPEGSMSPETLRALTMAYVDPDSINDVRLSLLQAEIHDLSGFPPHIIITAENDSLRFDGERYAQKLVNAGVEVFSKRFPGVRHGFTVLSQPLPLSEDIGLASDSRSEAIQMKVDALRRYLVL